jgi:hypothetical protein
VLGWLQLSEAKAVELEILEITLVRDLLEKIILSQGYQIVRNIRKSLIVSKVDAAPPQIDSASQCFGVLSIQVSGVKKLKTEDSHHIVKWSRSSEVWDLSCDCKRSEMHFTCRHRETVVKAVMDGVLSQGLLEKVEMYFNRQRRKTAAKLAVDLNNSLSQYLLRKVETLSDSCKSWVKLYALEAYGLTKEKVIEKGGLIKSLTEFQKFHLANVINSGYGDSP